jgi:hypothetical protein
MSEIIIQNTMKTKNKMLALLFIVIIAIIATSGKVSAQQNNISFQVFYDQLSPYGQWVDNPEFGNVWIPDAGPDFVPYSTRGYWIMTDYGWTWLSDYSWGWAPFHYGRWSYDNSFGWFWVPDYEWGPAWVNWRGSEGYYGWAPMQPGVSISMSFGMDYNSHYDHWNFVSYRNFGRSDMNRYYVNRDDHERIIRNSTVINNTYIDNSRHSTYVTGPSRDDVQRASGRKVRPVSIQESSIPEQKVSNGNLHIYRPQVTRSSSAVNQPKNETVPGRPENVSKPVANEIERHPNTSVPPEPRSNFNNNYKNDNAINSINSIKSNNSNNTNNFNNAVKNKNENPAVKTQEKPQQDANPSRRTVTDKQSSSPKQSNKSIRQSQRRSKSDAEKK